MEYPVQKKHSTNSQEEEQNDLLQERMEKLFLAENRVKPDKDPKLMTLKEARHYHWLRELHRFAENQKISKKYWMQLKAKRAR